MPDDDGLQDWTPPRGKGFRVIVWVLLTLIVLGSLGLLAMALLL